jgi:hypothetical protein
VALQATKLPGGIPMNGNFAPVLLQRRPKDSGLPIAGHGIPGNGMRGKVADEQVGCIGFVFCGIHTQQCEGAYVVFFEQAGYQTNSLCLDCRLRWRHHMPTRALRRLATASAAARGTLQGCYTLAPPPPPASAPTTATATQPGTCTRVAPLPGA